MLTENLNKQSIVEQYDAEIDKHIKKAESLLKKCTKKILTGKDITERDLRDYRYLQDTVQKLYERINNEAHQKLKADIDLFNKMAWELQTEFNASVKDDEIRFIWNGNSLSFATEMLAARYKLHAGMFAFSSGFTEHEAFTESGHRIKIGIECESSHMIYIKFNMLASAKEIYF